MLEDLNKLLAELQELRTFWRAEALKRKDEAGSQYAHGISDGFKHAGVALRTVIRKYSA